MGDTPQYAEWLTRIADELTDLTSSVTGRVGLAVRDLTSGQQLAIESQRVFPSASVIKLPVLVAALAGAQGSGVGLDRTLAVPPEARVGGTGVLKDLRLAAMTVRDLLTLMIVLSDNTATNVCLEEIGVAAVQEWATRGGCVNTRCERLMMDMEARERGLSNETTAGDMAEFLARLSQGDLLSPASTTYAQDILRRQQSRWGLARRLPPDIDLAHKTGEQEGLRHDVGLLSVGEQQAAIAVLCDGFVDPAMDDNFVGGEASDLLADIGELIYAAMRGDR